MRIRILAAITLAITILASSCSSSKTVLPYFVDIQEVPQAQLPAMNYMPKIAPDDELQITITSSDPAATAIFNAPEINPATRALLTTSSTPRMLTYMVSSAGDITMPQIGTLHVAGMTVEQLQADLTNRLSQWVSDPLVTVNMVNFTVSVGGEVRQPAQIPVGRSRITILDALAAAGDLTEYGERSNVLVIREQDGTRKYAHLNLNDSGVLTSEFYYLQPNDYVYVAPNNVRQQNSKYNQNSGFKLQIISTIVSGASVIASLVIALTVK